ncbi:cytochrome P450 4C1-like isoform X2 [Planococcus citri]|uniref:cytochrome P450 4C1-like isoform X2 n=1 Tax=Planococcus citri TaxID=170843 RepID=UPI0031F96B15
MSFVLTLTCIIIIVSLVNFIRKSRNKRFYELLEQFPSPPNCYPLIGNAHSLVGSLEGLLGKFEKMFKPYDRLVYWMGPIPILVLKKCEDIATVLNQSIDREDLGIMTEWLGMGMLNAKPEEWKKSRRVLAPAFSSDMLSKYAEKFDKTASDLVEKFRPAANSGEEIDVLHYLKNANLEAIVEAALGVSIQSCGKEGENFGNSVMEAMKQGAMRIQYPWLIPHQSYLHDLLEVYWEN